MFENFKVNEGDALRRFLDGDEFKNALVGAVASGVDWEELFMRPEPGGNGRSMFASQNLLTIDVPEAVCFEPGQRVTIRALSRSNLQHASRVLAFKALERIGSDGVVKLIEEAGGEAAVFAQAAANGPVFEHDWPTLIELGVVEWQPPRPMPMRQSALEEWTARAIFAHSRKDDK